METAGLVFNRVSAFSVVCVVSVGDLENFYWIFCVDFSVWPTQPTLPTFFPLFAKEEYS